jgi:adenine-specific DNA-methyltransferase
MKSEPQSPKGNIALLNEDASTFLSALPEGSVDLFICSPPYFIGKEYDRSAEVADFQKEHEALLPLLVRALKPGGSLCWQVGSHVRSKRVIPLDVIVYNVFAASSELALRNRIIWTFGHGTHAARRFSGRYETILWFTKGDDYYFDLDGVRVPQKYPGKRHYRGPKKGDFSGNPAGKNPSDIWEIPNVKSLHIEKTAHPCQFPVALVQRCIRSMTPSGGLVVDPFMGSGSSAVAAVLEQRSFMGCDIESKYVKIAKRRVKLAKQGETVHRPLEKPILVPNGSHAVSKAPAHFHSTGSLPEEIEATA